jgi:hypothetical protein
MDGWVDVKAVITIAYVVNRVRDYSKRTKCFTFPTPVAVGLSEREPDPLLPPLVFRLPELYFGG